MSIWDRISHGWNAFMNKDPTKEPTIPQDCEVSYGVRPGRRLPLFANERSMINSIYNRIAIDVAAVDIRHVKLDNFKRYKEDIDDSLNECLTVEANIDQTGRALRQDIAMTMFDEGVVAIVPIDTNEDPYTGEFSIESLRVGKVVAWYPYHVKIDIYNERKGKHSQIILPKKIVSIVENPLYSVMNEPNSTLKRLMRKLSLLDIIDEQSGSGRLDMIIQLPFSLKNEGRKIQAEERKRTIEDQLNGSKYGIAYIDSTEHITQLNRSIDNQLMSQVEYLQGLLHSQLGITKEIMDGTADEKTLNNYYNRTIEPILSAIVDEMKRKFLSVDARKNKESIMFFRDNFKLIPVNQMADIADKFTRNEIMTPNEIRQAVGMIPSADPNADELKNRNISEAKGEEHINVSGEKITKEGENQNESE